METFQTALWAFHLIIVIALVIVILLQRSEGGALGIGGSSGGDSLMSSRSASSVLTKVTVTLGILFFVTSLSLTYITKLQNGATSILTEDVDGVSVPVSGADRSLDALLNQVTPSQPAVPISE